MTRLHRSTSEHYIERYPDEARKQLALLDATENPYRRGRAGEYYFYLSLARSENGSTRATIAILRQLHPSLVNELELVLR